MCTYLERLLIVQFQILLQISYWTGIAEGIEEKVTKNKIYRSNGV